MNIAFLHYHLKTGGVTTVLRQQVAALDTDGDILVLTGKAAETDFPAETVVIPGLAYDSEGGGGYAPDQTAAAVCDALSSRWADGCDVLHVHNPTLAKNRNLLTILRLLQRSGIRLFLQIHDFAEDGRPQAFYNAPYPENCHYGVINSRDYRYLMRAGLDKAGLHAIPNTVNPLPRRPVASIENRHVLYPVRAIRRKNVGEAILASLFFPDDLPLCITQPPNSPADVPAYEMWKAASASDRHNVVFEAGLDADFAELVHGARFLLTTSITEGFGFSFLEPWTAGKMLWGRRLPDICRDFEENGIRLDFLYDRLAIPVEWFDETAFRDRWITSFEAAFRDFHVPIAPDGGSSGYAGITRNDRVDMGLLGEMEQREVVSTVLHDRNARRQLIKINPALRSPGVRPDAETIIRHNRNTVAATYTPEIYRDRLLAIYDQVMTTPVAHRIDRTTLAKAFLKPETFSLLKWQN